MRYLNGEVFHFDSDAYRERKSGEYMHNPEGLRQDIYRKRREIVSSYGGLAVSAGHLNAVGGTFCLRRKSVAKQKLAILEQQWAASGYGPLESRTRDVVIPLVASAATMGFSCGLESHLMDAGAGAVHGMANSATETMGQYMMQGGPMPSQAVDYAAQAGFQGFAYGVSEASHAIFQGPQTMLNLGYYPTSLPYVAGVGAGVQAVQGAVDQAGGYILNRGAEYAAEHVRNGHPNYHPQANGYPPLYGHYR